MLIVRVKFDRLDVPLILYWGTDPILLMAQMLVNCIKGCYSLGIFKSVVLANMQFKIPVLTFKTVLIFTS